MSPSPDKLYEAARDLSQELTREQRVELAHELLDTLADEDTDASREEVADSWRETLARRSQGVREGKVELVSGEEVGQRVEEVLAKNRQK